MAKKAQEFSCGQREEKVLFDDIQEATKFVFIVFAVLIGAFVCWGVAWLFVAANKEARRPFYKRLANVFGVLFGALGFAVLLIWANQWLHLADYAAIAIILVSLLSVGMIAWLHKIADNSDFGAR